MSNIVTASFANGAVTTTTLTALWQYDYGQILRIEGVELPVAYEVHFCNAGDADTVTSIGDSDGVVIPDQFLQNGKTIYAYIYLHAGADDGETEYKISIPVFDRAEPTDIEPTPAQESTIGQLIDALNEGVGDAEAAVEAAWDAAAHYPYINDDGNWMVWDADNGEFVDSGVSAEGSEPAFISYGSGLYSDIVAAVEAGKVCYCVYVDDDSLTWYIPLVKCENNRFIFSCSFRTSIYTAFCTNTNAWSISHEDMPVRGVQMPKNLGTKAVGNSYNFAREDHVHQMPSASDVGAYALPANGIPKTDLAADVQTSLSKADTALQSAPVTSVNNQTGAVTVSVPSASSTTPQALGTASAGSSTDFSRADHVHDFNSDFVTALLQLAEKAAYSDGKGQTYYQALYDALNHVVTYTVTNTLSGCTSSNSAGTATAESAYSATITASAGYTLSGATVSVTMGGNDITSTAYNNGTISIASVSGDILITVTAVAVTLSSISAVYTQSGTVYPNTSLDSLKTDLVVTATYSDSSTATIAAADYTLSGTLTVGTSTITVSYGGKTTTFTVTVSNQSRLPSEYQEVAWIEANKGPVIDTLWTPDADSEIHAGIQFVSLPAYNKNCMFGSTTPSVLVLAETGKTFMNFARSTSATVNSNILKDSLHDVVLNKDTCTVDGETKATFTGSPLAFDTPRRMFIFAFPKDDQLTPDHQSNSRCSYFQAYDSNNTLEVDLVPCYRKSDSVIGMYDLVANEFRTNVGTGTFTKGGDVT